MKVKMGIEEQIKVAKETLSIKDLIRATAEIQQELQISPPLIAYKDMNELQNQLHLIANEGVLSPKDKPHLSELTNWVLQHLQVRGWDKEKRYEKPLYLPPFFVSVKKCQEVLEQAMVAYNGGGYNANGYTYPRRNMFAKPYVDSYAKAVDMVIRQHLKIDFEEGGAETMYSKSEFYQNIVKVYKYIQLWYQMNDKDIKEGIIRKNGGASKKR